MKIGIDISQVVYGTGVSSYTRNLVRSLLEIDKKNEYVLFGGSLRRLNSLYKFASYFPNKAQKRFYPIPPTLADFLWNRLHILPPEFLIGKFDVFHASDWTHPPSKFATISTIHDLVPFKFPQSSHPRIIEVHKRRLNWVKREARLVIAVSENTKRDIIEILGIPQGRIRVIYEAPDPIFKRMGEKRVGEIRKKFKTPKKYLLAVGTDPRKNLEKVIEACEMVGLPLVVVGRKPIMDFVSHNIFWTGQVLPLELTALYSGAQALVYASLYEGFGLPILEAMACGCPVVTSNISSMPEVAGEAAVLVNPNDLEDIVRGIREALNRKEELIKKGFARVKNFSWRKVARQTLGVYREAVA